MIKERVEEYLGAIYRLRSDADTPVPLSQLRTYFDFSAVSIHEMIQKLEKNGWLSYRKYRGVSLTEDGEALALAVLRRHRLWERFLTDVLHMRWEQAHAIAHQLEHAAPEEVTEKLAEFLGSPERCPHGAPIPPLMNNDDERNLAYVAPNSLVEIIRITPETPGRLKRLAQWDLLPGDCARVTAQTEEGTRIAAAGAEHFIPAGDAEAIWTLACENAAPSAAYEFRALIQKSLDGGP